jgi:hypothetical protein
MIDLSHLSNHNFCTNQSSCLLLVVVLQVALKVVQEIAVLSCQFRDYAACVWGLEIDLHVLADL